MALITYIMVSADIAGVDANTLADVKTAIDGFSNPGYDMDSAYYGGADGTELLNKLA